MRMKRPEGLPPMRGSTKARCLVLARRHELCDEELLDVSEGKEAHLELVQIGVYVGRVVVKVVLADGRALDDDVLVVGNGIEDLAHGADEVELDDRAP